MELVTCARRSQISEASFLKVAQKYIPSKFLENIDGLNFKELRAIDKNGVDQLQMLMDKNKCLIDMYGSAEELASNLKTFSDIPDNHIFFSINICQPFSNTPKLLKSLDEKKFITKHDSLVHFQNCIFHMLKLKAIPSAMMMMVLKSSKWNSSTDLIEFDGITAVEFGRTADNLHFTANMSLLNAPEFTLDKFELIEVIRKFKELVEEWNPGEFSTVSRLLEMYWESHPIKENCDLYRIMYGEIYALIDALKKHLPKILDREAVHVVKLFEDERRQFVITDSLSDNSMILKTAIFESARKTDEEIQYILTPIRRAEHSAVPIMLSTGQFFKLAADVFFEFFHELIFVHRLFETSASVFNSPFFLDIEKIFDPNIETVFFINLQKVSDLQNMLRQHFPNLENESKNMKRMGEGVPENFTRSDVRNELNRLGLNSTVTGISLYVDNVYTEVLMAKKAPSSRTRDLLDIIKHCLLGNIINRFPRIAKFLHHQHGCHRVFSQCMLWRSNPPLPKYRNTVWKSIHISQVSVKNLNIERVCNIPNQILVCPNGVEIYTNRTAFMFLLNQFSLLSVKNESLATKFLARSGEIPFRTFLLEKKEMECMAVRQNLQDVCNSRPDDIPEENFLINLKMFMTANKNQKTLYLRTFSSTNLDWTENCQVFTEEVFDVIEVFHKAFDIKQQRKYSEKYSKTLRMPQLKQLLEEFDIDKRLITLVPDATYSSMALHQLKVDPGNAPLCFLDTQSAAVMLPSQAILEMFQSVVCDIDWTREACKEHPNCLETFKFIIVGHLRHCKLDEDDSLLRKNLVDSMIKFLKDSCNYGNRECLPVTPMVNLFDCEFNDAIKLTYFLSECERFNIKKYGTASSVPKKQLEQATIPVWKARILFMIAWADMFFDNSTIQLKNIVLEAINYKVPLVERKSDTDLMDLLLSGTQPIQSKEEELYYIRIALSREIKSHQWLKNTSWKTRNFIIRSKIWEQREQLQATAGDRTTEQKRIAAATKQIITKLEQTRTRRESIEKMSLDTLRKLIREPPEILLPIESYMIVDPLSPEEAPEEVPKDVLKRERHENEKTVEEKTVEEKIVKETTVKEKTVKENPAEKASENNADSKCCSKCLRTSELCQKAKEDLKSSVNKTVKLEKKLSAMEKELTALKSSEEITRRKQLEKDAETSKKLIDKLQSENSKLREAKTRLLREKEEKDKLIEDLLARVKAAEEPQLSEEMKNILLELQNTKQVLLTENPVKQATDRANELRARTNQEEVRQGAKYELQRVQREFNNYFECLDRNIEMIQKNPRIKPSEVPDLPALPSFSAKFEKEYDEATRQSVDIPGELTDPECLICLCNMTSASKTIKCHSCNRRYHEKCGEKWAKVKNSCPTCSTGLVKPSKLRK